MIEFHLLTDYPCRRIAAYLRLVVLSLGFPFAVKKGVMRESPIVQKACSYLKNQRLN